MQIVRFSVKGKIKYGKLESDIIHCFRGSPLAHFKGPGSSFTLDGSTYELSKVRLLAPCTPSKIVCLGLNYRSHAEESTLPIPSVPLIFLKPSTAVIGPDDEIVLPRSSRRVDYEGELAIVRDENTGNRTRKIYKLTKKGKKAYLKALKAWEEVLPFLNEAVKKDLS